MQCKDDIMVTQKWEGKYFSSSKDIYKNCTKKSNKTQKESLIYKRRHKTTKKCLFFLYKYMYVLKEFYIIGILVDRYFNYIKRYIINH